jgi:hypothetical protein
MATIPWRLDRATGRAAPVVQVRAAEVELAPDTSLLGRNGALGSEPADAVTADAEIQSRTAGVEPLLRAALLRHDEADSHPLGYEFGELAEQLIENMAAERGGGQRRRR